MKSLLCISLPSFYLNLSYLRTADYLTIRQAIKFDAEQKSSKFLLELMTLLPSANNTGSVDDCTSTFCLLLVKQKPDDFHRNVIYLTKFHDSCNQKPLLNHRQFLQHAIFG